MPPRELSADEKKRPNESVRWKKILWSIFFEKYLGKTHPRDWVTLVGGLLFFALLVIGAIALMEHEHQKEATWPCSSFANTPMKNVPLRCAPKGFAP